MDTWRSTAIKMGIKPNELKAHTVNRLDRVNKLCENGGGRLISRQLIATIIEWEERGIDHAPQNGKDLAGALYGEPERNPPRLIILDGYLYTRGVAKEYAPPEALTEARLVKYANPKLSK